MDPYRENIQEKIREHREIASAIIYDQLREEFAEFPLLFFSKNGEERVGRERDK